jgi:hypothetical protein
MPIRGSPNGAYHPRPQADRDRPEWVVAINRNAWSQSIGTAGRDHPVRAAYRALNAGSSIARTVLCEAAWNYRTTPKVGQWMKQHRPPAPKEVIAIAWKAQLRLHKTYKRLTSRGKRAVVATAAVARELLGFIWSIGRLVPLNP